MNSNIKPILLTILSRTPAKWIWTEQTVWICYCQLVFNGVYNKMNLYQFVVLTVLLLLTKQPAGRLVTHVLWTPVRRSSIKAISHFETVFFRVRHHSTCIGFARFSIFSNDFHHFSFNRINHKLLSIVPQLNIYLWIVSKCL